MNDEAAILRAVLASPGDDLPRLAYADWLEETGTDDDRAELIRVQIEAARIERDDGYPHPDPPRMCLRASCRICTLMVRADALLHADRDDGRNVIRWTQFVRELTGLPSSDLTFRPADPEEEGHPGRVLNIPEGYVGIRFRRGFVDKLALPAAAWVRSGDRLLATTPVVAVYVPKYRHGGMSVNAATKVPVRTEWLPGPYATRAMRVHLVDRPGCYVDVASSEVARLDYGAAVEQAAMHIFRREWPGVAFEVVVN